MAPAENLLRVHNKGLLLSTLEKDTILTSIKVFSTGRFTVETKDWYSYWQPLYELNLKELEDNLCTLRFAWHDYITSGFNFLLMQNFCFRYFSLLNTLLENYPGHDITQSWLNSLRAALGFECFGITSSDSGSEALGAGICTTRNPCYLLARLKTPNALDDPQFLPVITVADDNMAELFYHYRQYTLSPDSPISLMFYPAVSKDKRPKSFKLINSMVGNISYGIDPRNRERAKRLYQKIILPVLEANRLGVESRRLEFIDVGAGSGGLTAAICRQIYNSGFRLKVQLWFVDLEPADSVRFFGDKKLRNVIDSMLFLGDDYKNWLNMEKPLPAASGLRIALVSRLFNNLSRFSIHCFNRNDTIPLFKKMAFPINSSAHLPHHCLAPDGKGMKKLEISNIRLTLPRGRTFPQASLSDFYRGMYILLKPEDSYYSTEEGLFLPVRSFNPECLVTSEGKSVISCLVDNCDYVIIEDADMKPQNLIEHMETYELHSITIYNMTKVMGLTGNHAYIVWQQSQPEKAQEFGGERIW